MTRIGLVADLSVIDRVDANRPGTPGLTTGSHQPEGMENEIVPFRFSSLRAATSCLGHACPPSVDLRT